MEDWEEKACDRIRFHERMSPEKRAKIFMPFAALTGYKEKIEERNAVPTPMRNLSEEEKEELDRKLRWIIKELKAGNMPEVTVSYYVPAAGKKLGEYQTVTGRVSGFDPDRKTVKIMTMEIELLRIDNLSASGFDRGNESML